MKPPEYNEFSAWDDFKYTLLGAGLILFACALPFIVLLIIADLLF